MNSLTPQQRAELGELMDQAMADLDLAAEMGRLCDQLRARRPDLDWDGRARMNGDEALGVGDATTALEELADLEELEQTLGQDYPGASLDDVDAEAVRRALGRRPSTTSSAARSSSASWSARATCTAPTAGSSSPPRRSGGSGVRPCAGSSPRCEAGAPRRPRHPRRGRRRRADRRARGRGSSATSSRSTSSARWATPLRRTGPRRARRPVPPGRSTTSRSARPSGVRRPRSACSSTCRTRWCSTAPGARPSRPRSRWRRWSPTQFPQDALQVVGFSNYARQLRPHEVAMLDSDMVQGTNLQHALMVAGRFLDRHPDSEPVVLVVTDGEPTAHLLRDGRRVVRLAAVAGDARADARRGRPDDPARRDAQRVHARRRAAAARLRRGGGPPQRRPGLLPRRRPARRVRGQRLPPYPPPRPPLTAGPHPALIME